MPLLAALAAMLAVLFGATAAVAQPLVSVDWLKTNLAKPDLVVLDLRGDRRSFEAGHIPGSVLTNFRSSGWVVKSAAGVDGMLPEPAKLEALIGGLGIDNETHVVLVGGGRTANEMAPATRVYWTFKVLGHDRVSVLDGGFAEWIKVIDMATKRPLNPLASGPASAPSPRIFAATLRPEMIASAADVAAALKGGTPVLDHRDYDFYMGLKKSGAAKAAGTITGARHVPEGWMTQNGGGVFRSKAELERVYAYANVPKTGPQINFCNTGTSASIGWFVASELLGNTSARLYDGSLAEWTQDQTRPIDRKVKLN